MWLRDFFARMASAEIQTTFKHRSKSAPIHCVRVIGLLHIGQERKSVFCGICRELMSLKITHIHLFPLLMMYIPAVVSVAATAYFHWRFSPKHRQEVMAPTTGISEFQMAIFPTGLHVSSLL